VYGCLRGVSGKNNVLDEVDLFLGESVEVINERVYLLVGSGDGVLQRLPLRLGPRLPEPSSLSDLGEGRILNSF
jgi:hypothetical protein